MPTQTSIHFYVNWAKERLDEMEAALTSLEGKVGEVQADVRDKAKKILADLRKQRDDFRDTVKKQSQANEAAWISAKAKLEPEWNSFEAELKKYVESFGKEVAQQQAQALLCALQVQVVTKARLRVHAFDAGLLGIDFPGMEIENCRFRVV